MAPWRVLQFSLFDAWILAFGHCLGVDRSAALLALVKRGRRPAGGRPCANRSTTGDCPMSLFSLTYLWAATVSSPAPRPPPRWSGQYAPGSTELGCFLGSSGLRVWSGVQSVSEASGVDEGSGDVVGGVAESLGDAA